MNYYVATPTGTALLATCREYGFREMSCPVNLRNGKVERRTMKVHLDHYAIDNGAWIFHTAGVPCEYGPFTEGLARTGPGADFVVAPDVVAGGVSSLRLSEAWLPVVLSYTTLALIAVQDGMTVADVAPLLDKRVGIFVGGSHAWKWSTVESWAALAERAGSYIHVGRVNTKGRAEHCADLGVHSADGSTVARFRSTASRFVGALDKNRKAQRVIPWA